MSARFVLVAAGGLAVQLAVLQLIVARGSVPLPLAVAVAVEAAILHNFFWHERWTFAGRGHGGEGRFRRWWRFNAAAAVTSLAGNILITGALLAWVPMPAAAANALAVAALGLLNFALADRWAFREEGVRS